jgi:hypothetical protein
MKKAINVSVVLIVRGLSYSVYWGCANWNAGYHTGCCVRYKGFNVAVLETDLEDF